MVSACVAFPVPPQTALCNFDNSSVDDNSNKIPNFKCIGQNETRFKIYWSSKSADKMVCSPYEDYIKLNAYYKKVFDVVEKEFLNRTNR